jgi:MFS family permease
MTMAFLTYSCMYAFRKPFAVATFEGLSFLNIDLKIWLITAQLCGYALSKFFGIKIISELKNTKRAISILILIGIAEVALFLFAISPQPLNIIFLFVNGFPLGMVWGIVFSYLEGRRSTELLGAGLSVSFIFSSGFVKTIGKWLIGQFQVSEFWMPFLTGAIFALPLVLSVYLLDRVPPPDARDIQQRVERQPMNGNDRRVFFQKFSLQLILLISTYTLLTVFRDFRDNFSAEMWQSLGFGGSSAIFTITEIPIAIGVLAIISLVMFIKNNQTALFVNHLIIMVGLLLVGGATLALETKTISGPVWMMLTGMGLYLGYVPFNSIFFDRMIAAFRYSANVGFLIYLADSFGYLGSVLVMLYKNFGFVKMAWLDFFIGGAYILSFSGLFMILLSMISFYLKLSEISEIEEKKVNLSF